jgi:hypothetical protein
MVRCYHDLAEVGRLTLGKLPISPGISIAGSIAAKFVPKMNVLREAHKRFLSHGHCGNALEPVKAARHLLVLTETWTCGKSWSLIPAFWSTRASLEAGTTDSSTLAGNTPVNITST